MTMIAWRLAATVTVATLLIMTSMSDALAVPAPNPGNLPEEVPMKMMDFHPLPMMKFEPVPTLEIKPLVEGEGLYLNNCADCHGELKTSQKRTVNIWRLTDAMRKVPAMKKLAGLGHKELELIILALQ